MAEHDMQETLPEPGRFSKHLADFFASPAAAIGFVTLLVICCLALLAPWISPQNP